MPRLITDCLKHKACRQAIKFGDALTLEECRLIVRNLALCELPFQCAHGRPSVLPILRIRGDEQQPQVAYPVQSQ